MAILFLIPVFIVLLTIGICLVTSKQTSEKILEIWLIVLLIVVIYMLFLIGIFL